MKYDQNIIDTIVKAYEDGKDSTELSIEYKIRKLTIGYWIRKLSRPRHRGPKSKIGKEDYFSIIDSEPKAYWLGWIMADGCISTYNNQYSIKLHISIKDKELIDEFLNEIQSSNKTKYKEQSKSYYVSLTSKVMVLDLMKHNVQERKSGYESIPSTLPNSLMNHFIRGFFDGDGITCLTEKTKGSGFVSCRKMLNQIQIELKTNQKLHQHPGCFEIRFGIKDSKKLYQYLYNNATIFLKRKEERLKVISQVNTEIIN